MPTSTPHVPVSTPVSVDRTVAGLGAIMTLLSLARIPDHFGWSVDVVTAILGFALAAMAGVRAWWEGRELVQGGSLIDPAAVLASALLGVLGVLDVPSALELTPSLVLGLVTSALTTAASWRDAIRRRLAARSRLEVRTDPPDSASASSQGSSPATAIDPTQPPTGLN